MTRSELNGAQIRHEDFVILIGIKAIEEDLVHLINVLEVDQCRVGLVSRFDFGFVERESVCEIFFFCLITCVCENLDYELWVQFFNICCDFGLILFGLGLTN